MIGPILTSPSSALRAALRPPRGKPASAQPAPGRRSSTCLRTTKASPLKVELPEVDANDVDIQLEGNALILRGERKLENAEKREGYHRIERSSYALSVMEG